MKKTKSSRKKSGAYVKGENLELRKVVRGLKNLVKKTVPRTRETVNAWGVPTFEAKDPFCLYMVGKNHVTFGFHYGSSLPDPRKLLEGTGKNIRHVKLRSMEDLQQEGLKELIVAASQLEGKPLMKGMSGKTKAARA